jgi:hypothetical protein
MIEGRVSHTNKLDREAPTLLNGLVDDKSSSKPSWLFHILLSI